MGKSNREELLERIIRDTLWMARRYADGRQSYATGMYNEAARLALKLDVIPVDNCDGTWWAEDSMGIRFSSLSDDEWKQMMDAKGKCVDDLQR